jgi:hypothetical protein
MLKYETHRSYVLLEGNSLKDCLSLLLITFLLCLEKSTEFQKKAKTNSVYRSRMKESYKSWHIANRVSSNLRPELK